MLIVRYIMGFYQHNCMLTTYTVLRWPLPASSGLVPWRWSTVVLPSLPSPPGLSALSAACGTRSWRRAGPGHGREVPWPLVSEEERERGCQSVSIAIMLLICWFLWHYCEFSLGFSDIHTRLCYPLWGMLYTVCICISSRHTFTHTHNVYESGYIVGYKA